MRERVFPDAESVAVAAAATIRDGLAGGARTLVAAGGSTPRRTYELLSEMEVAWGRVTLLFGDERCVPADDPESNYLMVKRSLLDRVAPATVHRMPGELGPDEGARAYDRVVAGLQPLDLVILGIGPDGHTASLFPGHPALEAGGWAVGVEDAPKPPPQRVSLTLGTLRAARRVIFLVTGNDKAAGVAAARRGEVPAGLIPDAEWLLDQDAAGPP